MQDTIVVGAAPQMTYAREFARFACDLSLDAIPEPVVVLAKEHLLDAIGIAIASTSFPYGRAALEAVAEFGAGSQATVIGFGARMPAASAALVDGVLAHGLDFDDTHVGGIYHASAPAMAAMLPSAEANGATGAEALVAFIAALEIGCRLGIAGAPEFHQRGFHPTALCGTFAAAAAAGRLYGADEMALVNALGLCGSQAAGILQTGDSWLKRMHPGWAAHAGIAAVALGRAGFLGPSNVFEGPAGLYQTHLQRAPDHIASPTLRLGSDWQALGIALKPYPCCHFIHAFVDAALEIRGRFDVADVERIEAPLHPALHRLVAEPRSRTTRPTDPYAALFSVPYAVALALVRGRVGLADFYDEPLDAPDVLAVADLVWPTVDERSDFPAHFPGEVVAHLKDGRVVSCRKPASLGSPDVPLTRAAILEKFYANATRVVEKVAADRIAAIVLDLEAASSLNELLASCSA